MSGSSRKSDSVAIKNRTLFNTRFRNLTITEQIEVRRHLEQSPLLSECYRFVQRLYSTYDKDLTPQRAWRRIMKSWAALSEDAKARFSEFETFSTSYKRELVAYWSTRLTNGRSEANNRTIRDIQRVGRGLRLKETCNRAIYGASPTMRMQLRRLGKPDPVQQSFMSSPDCLGEVRTVLRHGLHKRGRRSRKNVPKQLDLFPP